MDAFRINGDLWRVRYVYPTDSRLFDRTGNQRIATTDPQTMTVYLSNGISEDMRARVLIHEIAHCVIYSYDLFQEIHRMVKRRYWIEAEEWICNFIADYGLEVFRSASKILGKQAILLIPDALSDIAA